jgi:4-amino-4-deoxy-L-arabinose transferase-like glycosyltransferase
MSVMRTRAPAWSALLALTVFGALLRFVALGSAPPGMYHDEAYYGLDALRVMAGERPVYFEANNGREPLYIYLAALSIGAFGREPWAERLPAALLGTLTIPAAYAMARAWFPGRRRPALLAAALVAFTFWTLQLSRIGFRVVSLPLFAALTLAALGYWLHPGHAPARSKILPQAGRWYAWPALAGALLGLSFYTYLAARLIPVALALFALWQWRARGVRATWREILVFGALAALVSAPLAWYAVQNPDIFLGRGEQVSIFSPEINHGDLPGALITHTLAGLEMFFVRGDGIARHNLPGRPVFDPLMAAFFVAGLGWCLARFRREPGAALVLLWCGVMLAPTILAEDTPHFLRAAGLLPVVLLVPAIALDAAAERWPSSKSWLAAALAFSALWTCADYVGYAGEFKVYTEFESAAVELAHEARAFPGDVYVSARLWRDFAALRFMLPESAHLQIVERAADVNAHGRALLLVWPHDPADAPAAYLARLPAGRVLDARVGPLAQGDLEPESYPLYVALSAEDPPAPAPPLATFANGVILRAARLEPGDETVSVGLLWEAPGPLPDDLTVYVHVLRDGQPYSGGDGQPLLGYWPTSMWRAGDLLHDVHVVELLSTFYDRSTDRVEIGLYGPDGARVPVVGPDGQTVGDGVEVR